MSSEKGHLILAAARRMIGVPYASGAANFPGDTDCSRLTQWCYSLAGLVIPRTAAAQHRGCTHASTLQGALLFFKEAPSTSLITHVGINAGSGKMVSTNRFARMVIEENWEDSPFWTKRLIACAAF
jgi:cell wall-associated NlpC family hydrolase